MGRYYRVHYWWVVSCLGKPVTWFPDHKRCATDHLSAKNMLWHVAVFSCVFREESSNKEFDVSFSVMTSLVKVIQHLENTPDLMKYGMLGLQQYSTDSATSLVHNQGSFTHCLLHTSVMMNLDKLQTVKYDKHRYVTRLTSTQLDWTNNSKLLYWPRSFKRWIALSIG